MSTYEICGTCSIRVDNGVIHIRLIPATGYISPDNKMAVLYPQASPPTETKLLPIHDNGGNKYIECPLNKKDRHLITALNSAAGSGKKIQLFLNDRSQITGCLYPTP